MVKRPSKDNPTLDLLINQILANQTQLSGVANSVLPDVIRRLGVTISAALRAQNPPWHNVANQNVVRRAMIKFYHCSTGLNMSWTKKKKRNGSMRNS
jgi:hypothetical protein